MGAQMGAGGLSPRSPPHFNHCNPPGGALAAPACVAVVHCWGPPRGTNVIIAHHRKKKCAQALNQVRGT